MSLNFTYLSTTNNWFVHSILINQSHETHPHPHTCTHAHTHGEREERDGGGERERERERERATHTHSHTHTPRHPVCIHVSIDQKLTPSKPKLTQTSLHILRVCVAQAGPIK